jgi:hypothetical protein
MKLRTLFFDAMRIKRLRLIAVALRNFSIVSSSPTGRQARDRLSCAALIWQAVHRLDQATRSTSDQQAVEDVRAHCCLVW